MSTLSVLISISLTLSCLIIQTSSVTEQKNFNFKIRKSREVTKFKEILGEIICLFCNKTDLSCKKMCLKQGKTKQNLTFQTAN